MSLAKADQTEDLSQVAVEIAKGYGKIQVSLPKEWKIQRFDQGWENSTSTFYLIGPPQAFAERDFPEKEEDWPPHILLQFDREIRKANPEGTRFRPMISDPERGKIKSGLSFLRWKTKGTNIPVTNGIPDLDGRFINYHFFDLPFQIFVRAKMNKWQEEELGDLLQEIVNSLTVTPKGANKQRHPSPDRPESK